VVAALFRDGRRLIPGPAERPEPTGKHVWASLSHQRDGRAVDGVEEVFRDVFDVNEEGLAAIAASP
jgi:hypothetical protein